MARICGVNLTDGESLPSVLFAAMAMPDVAARLRALFNIKLRLSALYTTLEAERGWLRTASRVLRDRVPMELLTQGAMLDVLTVDEALRHLTTS